MNAMQMTEDQNRIMTIALKGLKTTYTYSGPDIQPQMQMSSLHPSLSTGYDQALGVIQDSINTANPLASLNL